MSSCQSGTDRTEEEVEQYVQHDESTLLQIRNSTFSKHRFNSFLLGSLTVHIASRI